MLCIVHTDICICETMHSLNAGQNLLHLSIEYSARPAMTLTGQRAQACNAPTPHSLHCRPVVDLRISLSHRDSLHLWRQYQPHAITLIFLKRRQTEVTSVRTSTFNLMPASAADLVIMLHHILGGFAELITLVHEVVPLCSKHFSAENLAMAALSSPNEGQARHTMAVNCICSASWKIDEMLVWKMLLKQLLPACAYAT